MNCKHLLFACLALATFTMCDNTTGDNSTVDPYGESQFFIINNSTNNINATIIPIAASESLILSVIKIASGDTGYLGLQSGTGSPSPANVISEIDLKISDAAGNITGYDTIIPVSSINWISNQTQALPQKIKWFFKYL